MPLKLPGIIGPSDFGPDTNGISPEVLAKMQNRINQHQKDDTKNILSNAFGKKEYNKNITIEQKIKMFVDRAFLLAKKLGAIDENGNFIEDKLIKDSETGKVMIIKKFGKNTVMRFTDGKVVDSKKPSQQAVEFMIHLSDNKLSNTLNSKLDIKLLKENLSLFEIKKVINI